MGHCISDDIQRTYASPFKKSDMENDFSIIAGIQARKSFDMHLFMIGPGNRAKIKKRANIS